MRRANGTRKAEVCGAGGTIWRDKEVRERERERKRKKGETVTDEIWRVSKGRLELKIFELMERGGEKVREKERQRE